VACPSNLPTLLQACNAASKVTIQKTMRGK
jgi:hypothetical protein